MEQTERSSPVQSWAADVVPGYSGGAGCDIYAREITGKKIQMRTKQVCLIALMFGMGLMNSAVPSENSNPPPTIHTTPIATKAKNTQYVNEAYIGRYIRAANRFHTPINLAGIEIIKSKGETVEDVLTELINKPDIWASFSFEEKKEFTFIALIYGQLQGGGLTTLLILLEREATPIAAELGEISDKALSENFSLDQDGREYFRHRIKFLEDELKPLNIPSLN